MIYKSDGCFECESSFCSCSMKEDNEDYNECMEILSGDYVECVSSCEPGDLDCFVECNRKLAEKEKNCPCNEGCPAGCPCSNYQCSGQTTQPPITTSQPSCP